MCIIVALPKGKTLTRDVYEACYENNEDGAGMAYVHNGELVIHKGFFKFKRLYEAIKNVEGREMVVHCRIASTGTTICQNQCHPFRVDSEYEFVEREKTKDGKKFKVKLPRYSWAIFHNGRLDWRLDNKKSDTNHFVEDFLGPQLARDPTFLRSEFNRIFLEHGINNRSSINKLVILQYDLQEDKLETIIIGKKEGQEAWGCWFSNTSFYKRVKYTNPVHSEYGGLRGTYGASWEEEYGAAARPINKVVDVDFTKKKVIGTYPEDLFGVDQYGWYWDEKIDKWKNLETGHVADVLTKRPKRPVYMSHPKYSAHVIIERSGDKPEGKAPPGVSVPRDVKIVGLEKYEKKMVKHVAVAYVMNPDAGFKVKREDGLSADDYVTIMFADIRKQIPKMEDRTDEEIALWVVKFWKEKPDAVAAADAIVAEIFGEESKEELQEGVVVGGSTKDESNPPLTPEAVEHLLK